MPAYILETGRSYPNPITGKDFNKTYQRPDSGKYRSHDYHSGPGTNYKITFNDYGPGSMVLGQDVVYYIGDEEKTCVGNCYGERNPVYRWFRPGNNSDHKYTNEKKFSYPDDFPGESKKGKKVGKAYKAEPRKSRPVFYVARDSRASGTTKLYTHYNSTLNDSLISTSSSPPSGYSYVDELGYIWTSQGAAAAYASTGESPVPLYEYYLSSNTTKRDHFYTIDPANEVDLQTGVPGVPDCKDPRKERYSYVGIVGWVFATNKGKGSRGRILDIGTIGPTGICGIDRSGWYQYNNTWSLQRYRRNNQNQPPGVGGWGNPDNVSAINNNDALFEWYYGMNGAVKAAVPRYLSFENSYDSQFIYYLYDTSYPWNGPIYGIQYALSDAACCPNAMNPDTGTMIDCIPTVTYHGHYYEVRQDSWETYKTTLTLSDKKSSGVNESFFVADTGTKRILFRYTSTSGAFHVGETINGWNINQLRYFGDELQVGYMELVGSGSTFSYLQNFTSSDGATITVLAGYGIGDKAAFFGVYEFPKKISYYQLEIDPSALIPRRTLDQAQLECKINSKGEVSDVIIVSGGYGYTNPKIAVEAPAVLTEFSANDNARQVLHGIGGWDEVTVKSPESVAANPDGSLNNFAFKDIKKNQAAIIDNNANESFQERENLMPYGNGKNMGDIQIKGKGIEKTTVSIRKKQLRRATGDNKGKTEFRTARIEVSRLDENGSIAEVIIRDRGSGYDYDPDNNPKVFVVDVQTEKTTVRGPDTNDFTSAYGNTIGQAMKPLVNKGSNATSSEINQMDDGVIGVFQAMQNGFTAEYPTGYIRMKDYDDKESTKLCSNVPSACIDIRIPNIFEEALWTNKEVEGMMIASQAVRNMQTYQYPDFVSAARSADQAAKNLSHPYGWNERKECINIPQPKIYSCTRFVDLPCPYTEVDENGQRKAYGWMIYKYCASKAGSASFRVSMTFEGRTTGTQGQAFMNWVKSLPAPKLTQPRTNFGGVKTKTWPCKRGSIKGRCYRDGGDVVFAPTGTDENTYDWNQAGYSELEQLQTWLGANVTVGSPVTNPWTALGGFTRLDSAENETTRSYDSGSYTPISVTAANPPPNTCWDTFLRTGSNQNGVLDVYCAYPGNGNKTSGVAYYDVPELVSACVALEYVGDASIAIDPKDMKTDGIPFGPYTGVMEVLNYNTGSTITFGEAVNNFGNPYFDECETVFGRQDVDLKPAAQKKPTTKLSNVSYDPSDPERDEFDPEFNLPTESYNSETVEIIRNEDSIYDF